MGANVALQNILAITGDPKQFQASSITVPGSEQTLISQVVTAGKLWTLYGVKASSTQDGVMRVKVNTVVVGSARLCSGVPNCSFDWAVGLDALAGQTVEVTFEAYSFTTAVDVEAYLQYTEEDA